MIKEIKWHDHESLGNLVLNFAKQDGNIYNTIVLAGENGCGKTTVLSTLGTFLTFGTIEPFESIKYNIGNCDYTIYQVFENSVKNFATDGYHERKNEKTGETKTLYHTKDTEDFQNDLEDIRHCGCVYSKARSGFQTKEIKSVTTTQLDSSLFDNDIQDDFTPIKQLLVDIDNQDNSDWMHISEQWPGTTLDSFTGRKLLRFKNAFNNFFSELKFEKIKTNDPTGNKILFTKFGKEIDIDSLSTGEKQIVFRGAHLLRNSGNLLEGTILIDEPELSMHPKWQEKIFDYYRNLFTRDGVQSAQIIMATHSEYVIKSALKDPENVLVILLKNENGTIIPTKIEAPSVLPTISVAEVNYNAFGVCSTDYHNQLYGYLQVKESKTKVKECDDYITNSPKYDSAIHEKPSSYKTTNYTTLPTYIRNAIDHPDSGNTYTDEELKTSIEFLIELCK